MDWNALALVAAGGLIGIAGSFFNNLFQSKERQKDREEQWKQASIQASEKWIEHDILRIMNLTEKTIVMFGNWKNSPHLVDLLKSDMEAGRLSEEEYAFQVKEINNKISNEFRDFLNIIDTIHMLVSSFGDPEIYSTYRDFALSRPKSIDLTGEDEVDREAHRAWIMFLENGGKLQKILREKLISIREI